MEESSFPHCPLRPSKIFFVITNLSSSIKDFRFGCPGKETLEKVSDLAERATVSNTEPRTKRCQQKDSDKNAKRVDAVREVLEKSEKSEFLSTPCTGKHWLCGFLGPQGH